MPKLQALRLITRGAFFLLFVLAPVFDLLRYDLISQNFIFIRHNWYIGIDAFRLNQINSLDILWNFASLVFVPVVSIIAVGAFISWRWGLLYCGWLCPHESVVEIINHLMRRASGKITLWDKKTLPENQLDGTQIKPHKTWWLLTIMVVLMLAFTWAIVLLTYLLPPKIIYNNLLQLDFTRPQLIFLCVSSTLFVLEFTFARHLFCRFGCSVGLFQSLFWMLNKKAMVIGFDRNRAKECSRCDKSCEIACPIKLKPRNVKRKMFSCSHCLKCIDACDAVQNNTNNGSLLQLISKDCALDVSARGLGKQVQPPGNCYKNNSRQ